MHESSVQKIFNPVWRRKGAIWRKLTTCSFRLLKNREAAQQFRQRQRDHIDVLEKQVQQLLEQRAQYNTQTDLLVAENKLVRDQVHYMREFLSQALAFAFSQNVSRMYPMANTNIKTVDPAQM